ncbi:MAG: hypothetical protein MJZ64_07970 [Paludibacteraceae bacterium]|nr:hypothetical protein [Paludibacteraceae bacterium]
MKNEITRALVAKKKIFFFVVAALLAMTLSAQEDNTAFVTLTYCKPDEHYTIETICNTELPYVWDYNKQSYTAANVHDGKISDVVSIDKNDGTGCTTDYVLDVTVNLCLPIGACKGIFSVSDDKQVYFSMGNLQYSIYEDDDPDQIRTPYHKVKYIGQNPKLDEIVECQGRFRFAPEQWEVVRYENYEYGTQYNKIQSMRAIEGIWIDMFRAASSGALINNIVCSPILAARTETTGYQVQWSDDTDWGMFNAIENGGNEPGMWRTLSQDEWYYLFTGAKRINLSAGAQIKQTFSDQEHTNGVIFLPDDWSWSGISEEIHEKWKPNQVLVNKDNLYNRFTIDEWKQLEEAGAVFLPACGSIRFDLKSDAPTHPSTSWFYQSSTANGDGHKDKVSSVLVTATKTDAFPQKTDNATSWLYPVRLVTDVQPKNK